MRELVVREDTHPGLLIQLEVRQLQGLSGDIL